MTDTQMSPAVESGIVQKRTRPRRRLLLIFCLMPVVAVVLLIMSYVRLAQAQDQKRYEAMQSQRTFSQMNPSNSPYTNPSVGAGMDENRSPLTNPGPGEPIMSPPNNYPQQFGATPGSGYQVDTTYEYVPYTDPFSGVTQYRPQARTNYRQAQQGNWPGANGNPPPQVQSFNDTRIRQLVNELRSKQNEGADQSRSLAELQRLLDEEFSRMHKRQADEIEATEKRLVHLKKLHEERGNNRSQIVQRRIDQLTGKSNPLDWDMNPSVSLPPTITPGFTGPPTSPMPQTNNFQVPPDRFIGADPLPPGARSAPSDVYSRPSLPTRGYDQPDYTTPPVNNSLPTPSLPTTPAGVFSELRQVEVSPSLPNSDPNSRRESSLNRLNEVFAVISRAGEARITERNTARTIDTIGKLHENGRVSESEMQRVRAEFESASQKKKLLDAQLNAIQRTLSNEVSASKSRLHEATEAFESASTEANKTAARAEVIKLTEAQEAAQELYSQFEEAMELLNDQDTSEPAPSATIDPTIETDQDADTRNQDPNTVPQVEPVEAIAP
jgi:hypothetical protein